MEAEQPGQFIVVQHRAREVLEENPFLLLVHIQGNAADLSAFQPLYQRRRCGPRRPRLTLISMTPRFMRAMDSVPMM